jgi:hypothetical protein
MGFRLGFPGGLLAKERLQCLVPGENAAGFSAGVKPSSLLKQCFPDLLQWARDALHVTMALFAQPEQLDHCIFAFSPCAGVELALLTPSAQRLRSRPWQCSHTAFAVD